MGYHASSSRSLQRFQSVIPVAWTGYGRRCGNTAIIPARWAMRIRAGERPSHRIIVTAATGNSQTPAQAVRPGSIRSVEQVTSLSFLVCRYSCAPGRGI